MAWRVWHTVGNGMEPKRGRGRPRNTLRVDPADIPGIAVHCAGRRQLMEETGVSKHDAESIARVTKQNIEEFAETQRQQLQPILVRLADKIAAEMDSMKPAQAAIVYGILSDKLANQPKAITQALHLHIKGDAGSALAAILGPAAQSVFRASPVQDSKAPNYFPPAKPGPVLDVETTETT